MKALYNVITDTIFGIICSETGVDIPDRTYRRMREYIEAEVSNLKADIASLQDENKRLKALLKRWLEFSADVSPSCLPGEEMLRDLKRDSEEGIR